MSRQRSPIPLSITDIEQQAFLDELYKRRLSAISQISASASTSDIINKVNALIAAMQASGAMEEE